MAEISISVDGKEATIDEKMKWESADEKTQTFLRNTYDHPDVQFSPADPVPEIAVAKSTIKFLKKYFGIDAKILYINEEVNEDWTDNEDDDEEQKIY